MSEAALKWAAEQVAPDALSKFLLMRLAAYADAQGFGWAFVKLLADEMGVSERTVQGRRKRLVECDLIEATGRTWRTKSNRLVPVYRLPLEREGVAADLDDDASSVEGATGARTCTRAKQHSGEGTCTHTGAAACTRIRKEGERRESSTELSPRKRDVDEAFKRWMGVYPRKAEQRAAHRIFERILRGRRATADELVSGAQRYAIEVRGRDLAMVKNPTTWLQRECWIEDSDVAPVEAPKGLAGKGFDLPSVIVTQLMDAAPDVGVCLHGATWREADRTILTLRQWGADELIKRVGPVRLRALDLKVERAA